jgi:hypothetical protein
VVSAISTIIIVIIFFYDATSGRAKNAIIICHVHWPKTALDIINCRKRAYEVETVEDRRYVYGKSLFTLKQKHEAEAEARLEACFCFCFMKQTCLIFGGRA